MFDKRTVLLVISILVLPGAVGYVAGQESHLNFDEAEEDVDALYITLGRTKNLLEKSLNRSLDVNLTVDHDDYIIRHDQRALDEAYNHSMDALDIVGYSEDILEDIEGEVSSYEYLEALFKPYSRSAHNVSSFCETHKEMISNLKTSMDLYQNWSMNHGEVRVLVDGLRYLNTAYYNTRQMIDYTDSTEQYIGSIQDERLDNQELLDTIDDISDMLERYDELIKDLLMLYDSFPSHMDLIVPSSAHPGEEITVSGLYLEEGEYVGGVEVDLYVDNESIRSSTTEENGFFEFRYKIPWDVDLGPLNITVSKEETARYSNIEIVKYPSWIDLSIDRDEYYQEEVNVEGIFDTDADISLDIIHLDATLERNISVSTDGGFQLEYDPSRFDWGMSTIDVEYPGNETIEHSSASVSFSVNIPTSLTLLAEVENDTQDIEKIHINGLLQNASSHEGLSGFDISLLVDGDLEILFKTDEHGVYNSSLDVEDVAPRDGLYRLESVFNGTEKFRSTTSDPIYIYREGDQIVVGEDPDELEDKLNDEDDLEGGILPGLTPEEEAGWFIIFLVVLFMVYIYFIHRRRITDLSEEDSIDETKDNILQKRKSIDISAESEEDIPEVYRAFIDRLADKAEIPVTKGTTHRDIEKEVIERYGVQDIKTLTSVFEKVFFANIDPTSDDLQRFNESLISINAVVG